MITPQKGCTYAIIPARSSSKGIRDKNISELCGFPLLAYSVAAAKLCPNIERVIVSTDSELYAKVAMSYGAEVPFLRPAAIAKDSSTDLEYLQYTLSHLSRYNIDLPEYIALLRPTTPIRNPEIIADALQSLINEPTASAVVSVSKVLHCPYKWMKINSSGYLDSLIPDMKPDDVNLPRQSFNAVYNPNGYIDVLRSEVIMEHNFVYGGNAKPFIMEESITDIDSPKDFATAETKAGELSALREYLYSCQCGRVS